MGMYKGRITKIEKKKFKSCQLTQGIKREEQYKYENSPKYNGSNGSYSSNYKTEYHVYLYLTIYGQSDEDNRRVKMDIRDSILYSNNLKRISTKKINEIVEKNVGKKVSFDISEDEKIIFDDGQLIL